MPEGVAAPIVEYRLMDESNDTDGRKPMATASGIARVPWGAITLAAGAVTLLAAIAGLAWGPDVGAGDPRAVWRLVVFSGALGQAPWALGIASLLLEGPTGRRRATWGIALLTAAVLIGAINLQARFGGLASSISPMIG